MTDLPDVKLKAVLAFPAEILDGTGIDVAKINGAFRFDLAYDDFAPPVTTLTDATNQVMLVWNVATLQYGLAPVNLLLGSGSAFPSTTTPAMDSGAGDAGASALYARGDHVHPSDSTKAPLASPTFTGTPAAPTATAGTNTTQIASTAFVTTAVASSGATPAALTRTNDTNVTLTLGGTPATALLQASSITAGWTGTLAQGRGGFGVDISAVNGVPVFATGTPTFTGVATAAEYISNSAPTKMLTPGAPWSAATPVALSGTSVTPNLSAGIDFTWTMSAVGSTLVNPTSPKPGQKGMLYLVQDATGNRTITTWGSFYKFPGGVKPTLSTAANAIDVISFAVKSSTEVECFFAAGMA